MSGEDAVSSQIYIIETRYEREASPHSTAYLNQEPDARWSARFQAEAATLGSGLELRQDRIVSATAAGVSADEVVHRVNSLVAG